MSKVDNAKSKGQKHAKQMLVRYGRLGQLGWFDHHEAHIPRLNEHVIIKTERGLELGQIVGIHNYRGGQFKSTPEKVEQYFCNRTKDYPLGEFAGAGAPGKKFHWRSQNLPTDRRGVGAQHESGRSRTFIRRRANRFLLHQ